MRGIVPASCEALVQFILGSLEPALEDGNAIQVGAVLQVFELFAQLHLLQQKLRIMHRDLQRQLATIQGEQVTRALGWTLERLVGLVEARGLFQRQPLLALGSVSKAVRMNAARQLTVARSQLIEVQIETRLQLK
ncbi:hypothetical protein D3C75_1048710 [compost metagenome]